MTRNYFFAKKAKTGSCRSWPFENAVEIELHLNVRDDGIVVGHIHSLFLVGDDRGF